MASYANFKKMETDEIVKYCRLNSFFGLIFDMTNWDFTKYIASKDKYWEACQFHIQLIFDTLGIKDTKPNTDNDSKK